MAVRGTAHNCSNSKRDNHGCTIMGTGTELHHRNTHILVVDVMVPAKTLPSGVSDLLSLSLYLRQSGFLPWNTQIKKKMGVQNLYETFEAINLGITTRTAHVPISLYHTHKHKTQSKQRPRWIGLVSIFLRIAHDRLVTSVKEWYLGIVTLSSWTQTACGALNKSPENLEGNAQRKILFSLYDDK